MTRRQPGSGMTAALISMLLLTAVIFAQQKPATQKAPQTPAATSPDALLGQALHEEEVEGRLQSAIALYQKVLKASGVTRAQAGRAQFRIGACYERLGLAEARKAYEAVVANYPDQVDLAAEAKARLAALAEPVARGGGPVLRQIWATRGGIEQGRISPDGRSVVGVDGSNAYLVIRSTATGDIRRLIASDRKSMEAADSPVWSRDGRQIAYLWEHYSVDLPDEFRIADATDGTSRVIPTDARFRLRALDAWSPDGRSVLARVQEGVSENRRRHLAWIGTSDGTVQLLASAGAGKDLGPAFLSPDGAWIVSRVPDDDPGFSISAARGGTPRTLMPATASDELVGWSADGTHVLFLSRQGGLNDLMAVRVLDGQAAGRPFLIRTLQAFSSLGISQAGALLYQSTVEARMNLYRASFEMTSGRVSAPARVEVSTGQQNGSPSWSPDGRRLAYVSWSQDNPARTLSIWSAETAQTRSFSLPFSTIRWSWHPTTWSADGRWVYMVGTDDVNRGTVLRVNAESGIAEAVVPWEPAIFEQKDPKALSSPFGWSPDARIIYKADLHILVGTGLAGGAISAIVEHRVADRAERELFRLGPSVAKLAGSAVSPDGSQLAFGLLDYTAGKLTVLVMPAAGGPTRAVAEVPGTAEGVVRWTHDSRSIVFLSRGDRPEGRLMCDLATGVVRRLALPSDMVQDIAFSPNGKEIAYVGGDNPDRGVWMLENFLPPTKGK
jgi:Tol biopolymer transport system component